MRCHSQLMLEMLTPMIEGRWVGGYGFPPVLSAIRSSALLLEADPHAGGALTGRNVEKVLTALNVCKLLRLPDWGHSISGDHPVEALLVIQNFFASTLAVTEL